MKPFCYSSRLSKVRALRSFAYLVLFLKNLTGSIHTYTMLNTHKSFLNGLRKDPQNLTGFAPKISLAFGTINIFTILFFTMTTLSAQNSNTQITLWEKDQLVIPKYDYVEQYDSTDIVRIKKVTDPFIEVYLPSRKNRSDVSVVICPGGGYGILAWDWEGQDVAKRLKTQDEGTYKIDLSKSALSLERTKAFPKNVEFEALLTFDGDAKGRNIRSVTPTGSLISVIQHHSFIEYNQLQNLKIDNYQL